MPKAPPLLWRPGSQASHQPPARHSDLRFYPIGLAAADSTVRFSPPVNAAEGSFRLVVEHNDAAAVEFDCVSPRRALELAGFNDCALCKLDIEGFEYEVLDALLAGGFRPVQIAVEFHHFMPGIPWRKTLKTVFQLQRAGYRIVRKRQTDYLFVRKDCLS